jgi:hypothetical protein
LKSGWGLRFTDFSESYLECSISWAVGLFSCCSLSELIVAVESEDCVVGKGVVVGERVKRSSRGM